MINDYIDKTVKISVRIVNGKVRYFYGGELPLIKNGAIGELIISEHDVEDKDFVLISQFEDNIEILPKDTKLMFAINNLSIPEELKGFAYNIKNIEHKSYLFVEAILLQPLVLQLRGSKMSNLLKARCNIPSLNKKAISLNNGITIISEAFEPERKSHTGNVFEKCYYKREDNIWYPLDYLRRSEEYKYEEKLFLDNNIYIYKFKSHDDEYYTEDFSRDNYSENELKIIDYLVKNSYITGSNIKKLYSNDKNVYIELINYLMDKDIIFSSNYYK